MKFKMIAMGMSGVLLGIGLLLGFHAQGEDAAAPKVEAGKGKVIVFYGVYTQWYKFDAALRDYELKIANARSDRVKDFPSVKELFGAKLVILSDVSGKEFTEAQVKLLKSYVEGGGGLLVMGGAVHVRAWRVQREGHYGLSACGFGAF